MVASFTDDEASRRLDDPAISVRAEALVPGAVFVHRATGYVFQLRAENAVGSTLRFETVGEYRSLTLPRAGAPSQLRLPMDAARADELERLIVHAQAVLPDRDLDLLLYMRGTPEQEAAAIATLMDRVAEAPGGSPSMAASDLRFQRLRLLGELAWVKGRAVDMFGRTDSASLLAYTEELRARRQAVPPGERRSTVVPPHVPVVPDFVMNPDRVDEDGWHVIETRLAGGAGWFAATLGHEELQSREELGAAGELTLSTLHRDDVIQWIVLSEHGPARVESTDGAVHATIGAETTVLQPRSPQRGQMLVVAQEGHPADLLESIDLRLRYPQAQLLAWGFGLAANPAMDSWTLFTGRTARGGSVWAFACGDDAVQQ